MEPADYQAVVETVDHHPLPYFSLTLRVPAERTEVQPGQFVMVRVGDGLQPFLRRAFSVHDVARSGADSRLTLLAKVVGTGTQQLAAARPGDPLWVLGPLGHGFSLGSEGRVALVAGGIGSAPLFLLAKALLSKEQPFDLYYGGRSAVDLPRREAFAHLLARGSGDLILTTEDGSLGERGLVTVPLERACAERRYTRIYSCGPHGLLACLAAIGSRHGVPGEAALESPMGCGFGACLGCAIRTPGDRYLLCCTDGPVLRFDEVAW